eukprot:TRINITY_DN2420_c0_g1_i3.p1 TRINITY_DN2420_c0_g1~~TRINITY_DN2420_c0_g1_i3.p1  ORF type:complete len:507 (-),score=115.09 TRINITY_DN2420_c0_g1_i3:518-2038(-)
MTDRTKRLAELAEKKKKLQALKTKLSTPTQPDLSVDALSPSSNSPYKRSMKNIDIDELLSSVESPSAALNALISDGDKDEGSRSGTVVGSVEREVDASCYVTHHGVYSFDIMPKEIIMYSKGTQTERVEDDYEDERSFIREDEGLARKESVLNIKAVTNTDITPSNIQVVVNEKESDSDIMEKIFFINDEDKKVIFQNPSFQYFLHKNSLILERSLQIDEHFNIMKDYTEGNEEKERQRQDSLTILQEFYFDQKTRYRSVTDIDWSPHHPELFAVAYSSIISDDDDLMVSIRSKFDSKTDYDGLVLVWSTEFTDEPQFVLQCQSPVLSVKFSPFNNKLLVGGTYSGQIVIWDLRSPSSLPVMKSPLSSIGHSHPVYSLSIVGTDKANNIVTSSTDGRVCVWNFSSIDQPYSVLELTSKVKGSPIPVYVTSMTFPEGEENVFYLGAENGSVLQGCLHGDKSGITRRFAGHFGPVTSCDIYPFPDASFGSLLLTSSVDWTVNLWVFLF